MILAVDLGKKTTGLAISSGTIAQPHKTITHSNLEEAVEKISNTIDEESAQKLIVGFVEGQIKGYFLEFADRIKSKNPRVEVILRDESLTSNQATVTMLENNIPKHKRRGREHEFAAALLLQGYLDELDD